MCGRTAQQLGNKLPMENEDNSVETEDDSSKVMEDGPSKVMEEDTSEARMEVNSLKVMEGNSIEARMERKFKRMMEGRKAFSDLRAPEKPPPWLDKEVSPMSINFDSRKRQSGIWTTRLDCIAVPLFMSYKETSKLVWTR